VADNYELAEMPRRSALVLPILKRICRGSEIERTAQRGSSPNTQRDVMLCDRYGK
jgi:hypothetical protein